MGFPSGKTKDTLTKAFDITQVTARNLKQSAIDIRDTSLAGDTPRKTIMEFPTTIADALDTFNTARAKAGIDQHAKDQLEDQTLTLGADFTTMVTTAESVRDWIVTNFPANGSGFLLERKFDVDGRMVVDILSTVQTAQLRTALGLLIASIDD